MRIKPTSEADYERLVARVYAQKDNWRKVEYSQRTLYLEAMQTTLARIAPEWVRLCCQAKGVATGLFGEGEEWMLGPLVVSRALKTLKTAISARFRPYAGYTRRRIDGRSVVPVFPNEPLERVLWLGMHAETWVQGAASQGRDYQASLQAEPVVCLVLGAGNVSSIAATDLLSKLFLENKPVILKMNPVNDYLGPILEELLFPLIRDGFVALIYGDVTLAKKAVADDRIQALHLTGSHQTYEAIRAASTKPLTAELGCVSPVIVVPGPWTRADLRYQARHLASMKAFNAGCNCVAAQVVVTHRHWSQREAFLDALQEAIERLPQRPNYYPGSSERHQSFLSDHNRVFQSGIWSVVTGLPAESEQRCFSEEAFCGFLAEACIEAEGLDDFLSKCTEFCNQVLWGDLSATVLIHPRTERLFENRFHRMLAELRYGTIGVNLWPGVGFGLMNTPWGAHPGPGAQSGNGFVHNTAVLDQVEKTLLRGLFATPYVPPWFVDHPQAAELGKRLTHFESQPSLASLLSVQRSILRAGWAHAANW